jgi:molybdopterin-guanine dinucleotide biosynthesis protein A
MGVDKASLPIAGQPLWQRQLRVLGELQPRAIWVSARTVPQWCPAVIEPVLDRPPSRGPISGLAAALGRVQTSHLLVLAVDLPQMTAAHLRHLWSRARPGVGVIPRHHEWFEPLCAVYPSEAAAAVNEALSRDDFSLQRLAQVLLNQSRGEAYELSPGDQTLYLNMNTPSEIPAACRI